MNQIITYLTFNGNCKEAMEFYQSCLGGELEVKSLTETPYGDRLPDEFKKLVVTASLKKESILLMGTDLGDDEVVCGNRVSMLLKSKDESQIRMYYEKLVQNGKRTHPLEKTYRGDLFGQLTDRYGLHWLFHCRK
ncbi:VOC family protein [Sinomicrobium oceani]|uniref:VOC family protein n=1 Tax=Sinomicrobium oceani TaxID=1150368 RepID=UPI00227A8FF9|nr:VOC family protein [Sinomicrobium oceani]